MISAHGNIVPVVFYAQVSFTDFMTPADAQKFSKLLEAQLAGASGLSWLCCLTAIHSQCFGKGSCACLFFLSVRSPDTCDEGTFQHDSEIALRTMVVSTGSGMKSTESERLIFVRSVQRLHVPRNIRCHTFSWFLPATRKNPTRIDFCHSAQLPQA